MMIFVWDGEECMCTTSTEGSFVYFTAAHILRYLTLVIECFIVSVYNYNWWDHVCNLLCRSAKSTTNHLSYLSYNMGMRSHLSHCIFTWAKGEWKYFVGSSNIFSPVEINLCDKYNCCTIDFFTYVSASNQYFSIPSACT